MNRKELKQLFFESKFIYPNKLEGLNLDLAINNIIESYKTPDHLYYIKRDINNKLVAHLGLLHLGNKTWMGHNHCSLKSGLGAEVFVQFAFWVAENYGKKIEHLLGFYRRNPGFYKGIYDAVNDENLCTLTEVGYKNLCYPEDETYGINLSHWHKQDNINDPPRPGDKIYTKWYFRCTKEAIEKSFDFFNKITENIERYAKII